MVSTGLNTAAHPSGFKITGARLTSTRGEDVYEVQASAGDLTYVVTLTPQGEVLSLRATSTKARPPKGDTKRKKPEKPRDNEPGGALNR